MAYILKNGQNYCYVNSNNAVLKTQDVQLATRFKNAESAEEKLRKASRKLSGFKVINTDNGEEESVNSKVKRKNFTQSERVKVYNKNRGRCAICGKFVPYDEFTVDHIIPLAKGGTNKPENLQCTCKTCNLIKQDILPEDLMEKLIQIVLYQMKIHYDKSVWNRINRIRKERQKLNLLKLFEH